MWGGTLAGDGSAFAKALCEPGHDTDERWVVPCAREVHSGLEVAGQLCVTEGVQQSADADDDFAPRLNILSIGLLRLGYPTCSRVPKGLKSLGVGFDCVLGVEVHELLPSLLRQAEFAEQRAGFLSDAFVKFIAVGHGEVGVLLRDTLSGRLLAFLRRFSLRRLLLRLV